MQEYIEILQLEKMGFTYKDNTAIFKNFAVQFTELKKGMHVDFFFEERLLCGTKVTNIFALSIVKDILIDMIINYDYFPTNFKDVQALFFVFLQKCESSKIKGYDKRKIKKRFKTNIEEFTEAIKKNFEDKNGPIVFNNITGIYYQIEYNQTAIFISSERIIDVAGDKSYTVYLKKNKWYKHQKGIKLVQDIVNYLKINKFNLEGIQEKFNSIEKVIDITNENQNLVERALYNDIDYDIITDMIREYGRNRIDEDID